MINFYTKKVFQSFDYARRTIANSDDDIDYPYPNMNLFQLQGDLYLNKAVLKHYEWIISQKTFFEMNYSIPNIPLSEFPYLSGNQTDLWID